MSVLLGQVLALLGCHGLVGRIQFLHKGHSLLAQITCAAAHRIHVLVQLLLLPGSHSLMGGSRLLAEGRCVSVQLGVIPGQVLALLGRHDLVSRIQFLHKG